MYRPILLACIRQYQATGEESIDLLFVKSSERNLVQIPQNRQSRRSRRQSGISFANLPQLVKPDRDDNNGQRNQERTETHNGGYILKATTVGRVSL